MVRGGRLAGDFQGVIQHFILTRSYYRQTDLKYLRYRFRMMRNFCGASLAVQTRRDFTWIVRCNADSPIAGEVADYLWSLPFPVACVSSVLPEPDASDTIFTDDPAWKEAIQNLLLPETTHVLTTRIDDDDLIAPSFVERLRNAVVPSPEPAIWNFSNGYVLKLSTARPSTARKWEFERNQFASLVSPVEPLTLVRDATHGSIGQLGPIHIVDRKPAFVWTRHPLTKSPGGRSRTTIPVAKLASQFPVLKGVR